MAAVLRASWRRWPLPLSAVPATSDSTQSLERTLNREIDGLVKVLRSNKITTVLTDQLYNTATVIAVL